MTLYADGMTNISDSDKPASQKKSLLWLSIVFIGTGVLMFRKRTMLNIRRGNRDHLGIVYLFLH